MGTEIERKFLLRDDGWYPGDGGSLCRQGYLVPGPPVSVRVRIMDGKAMLNIKAAADALRTTIVRDEFEYPIPIEDAEMMLQNLCEGHLIEKTRYRVPFAGMIWEIDRFEGVNAGLVVAEIELDREDQTFPMPPWLGREVSHDPRYLNASLCRHPYTLWPPAWIV